MRPALRFLIALTISLSSVMVVRALAFTIYTVGGDGLEPTFKAGDHVMVNRWSYGLRTGSSRLFGFGRLCRQPVERGDIVAFEDPTDSTYTRVLFGKVKALPGDTIRYGKHVILLPSLQDCADHDYYWIQSVGEKNTFDSRIFGPVADERVIGRAFLIIYSHDPSAALWRGYPSDRWLLPL